MRASFFPESPTLPVVVEPDSSTTVTTLLQEIQSDSAWVNEQLLTYGAILFRGYEIQSPADFQCIAQQLIPEAVDYARGASPRSKVRERIYTSTDAPKMIPIPLHCELSYTPSPPNRILFFCHTPAQEGGETPIADMRSVYRALDPEVRQRLEGHGLMLIQNVPARRGLGFSKTWQEMFATDKEAEVENICATMDIACSWNRDGSLRLINHRPVSVPHPVTGDRILFTSFYNFHDSWSDELSLYNLFWLSRLLRLTELLRVRTGKAAVDYPHHSTYADGTEISRADVLHVRKVLRDHAVSFSWQPGDLILLDNFRVSHGRMPYRGNRKILVSMGNSPYV